MLTSFLDDNYAEEALRYGAYGYILKTIRSEDLIASIRAIFRGSVLFSPELLKKLIPRMDSKANREDAGETDNEYREIISHLGNREKDIGLVQQPALLNPDGFGLLNKSRKRLHLLLVL